jgi:hypothetical protein
MKKKSLVLVIALLCMASLLAAMAYTSAEVKASYTVKVVASDKALLALVPSADADGTVAVDDKGNLVLDFGKSGSKNTGLQPGSKYVWKDLVTVKNNSDNNIKVTVANPEGGHLAITSGNSAVKNTKIKGGKTLPLTFTVTVPAGAELKSATGNIVVSATTN